MAGLWDELERKARGAATLVKAVNTAGEAAFETNRQEYRKKAWALEHPGQVWPEGPAVSAKRETPIQRWIRKGSQAVADALTTPGSASNQQVAEGFETVGGLLSPVDPESGMPNADFGSKAVVPLAVKLNRRLAIGARTQREVPVIERFASTPKGKEHVKVVKEIGFEDTLRPKYETPGPKGSEIDRRVSDRESLFHATRYDLASDIVTSRQIGLPGRYGKVPTKQIPISDDPKSGLVESTEGVSLGRINKIKTTISRDVIFELNRRKMKEVGVPTRPYMLPGFEKMQTPYDATYGHMPAIVYSNNNPEGFLKEVKDVFASHTTQDLDQLGKNAFSAVTDIHKILYDDGLSLVEKIKGIKNKALANPVVSTFLKTDILGNADDGYTLAIKSKPLSAPPVAKPSSAYEFEERTYQQAIPLRPGMVRRAFINLDNMRGRSSELLRQTVEDLLKVTDDIRPYHTPEHGATTLHRQLPSNLMTRSGSQELPRVKSFEDLKDVMSGMMPVAKQTRGGIRKAEPVGMPREYLKALVPVIPPGPPNHYETEAIGHLNEIDLDPEKFDKIANSNNLPMETWQQMVSKVTSNNAVVEYPKAKKAILNDLTNGIANDLFSGETLGSSLFNHLPSGSKLTEHTGVFNKTFLKDLEKSVLAKIASAPKNTSEELNANKNILKHAVEEIDSMLNAIDDLALEKGMGAHKLWEGKSMDAASINPSDLGGMTPSQAKSYISNYTGLGEGKVLDALYKDLIDQFIKGGGK